MKTKPKTKMGPPTLGRSYSRHRPRTRSSSEHFDPKPSEKLSDNTNESVSSGIPPPTTAAAGPSSPLRISRARKALYLDFENASLADSNKSRVTNSSPNSYTDLNDRVPPLPTYLWSNPLPPPVQGAQPSARRSQRLILKHEASPEPESVRPGFSQEAIDCLSAHSDYGTASENSFCMREAVRRGKRRGDSNSVPANPFNSLPKRIKTSLQSDTEGTSQSQGYESDMNAQDNLSDLVLHELDTEKGPRITHSWDSDDEPHQVVEKRRKVEDWVCGASMLDENSFDLSPELHVKLISHRGIHCLIPLEGYALPPGFDGSIIEAGSRLEKRKTRLMGPNRQACPFSIETFNNLDVHADLRRKGLRVVPASPVVLLEPRGTKFELLIPAILSIPLDVYPAAGDEIYCLFSQTSTKQPGENFRWCVHRDIRTTFDEYDGRTTVSLETTEFAYYVIVIREKSLMATKQIRSRTGGRLVVPDSLIEISFPKGSVPEDIVAKVRVHLDTELSLPDFLDDEFRGGVCLASPILLLEPHGRDFGPEGVTIQLPIPDYDDIIRTFGSNARLTIWESRTDEHEVPDWKWLNVNFTVGYVNVKHKHIAVISFKVTHFSFFRAVWDLISASLYDAKVGVSYFYPFMSFAMKCQANMEENTERNSFGLEVICYRSDKMLPLPELSNYIHRVGACSKPKLVRPGKIIVRLKSLFFEADVDAGEDPNLEKEEADFRGRDFEMQYACKFKPDVNIDRGTFGKVIIKRFLKAGCEEALFEFNLQKSGHEGESTPHDRTDRWQIVALKELGTSLFITDGDNWKVFASQIGFTKREIKLNLKNTPDPFVAMIRMYEQRGGDPDKFVQVLYNVHRELKINGGVSPASNSSKSSHGSSGRGSLPGMCNRPMSSDSDTSGTQISQDSLLNGTRKRSNPSVNRSGGTRSNENRRKRKKIKLSSRSADDESSSSGNRSSSTESDREDRVPPPASSHNTSIDQRNDLTKLGASFLWEMSAFMDGMNWRALGRTLGLDESILLNIEHTYKLAGFRECTYQMLLGWKEKYPKRSTFATMYSALRKENMNAVAKKMKNITNND